VFETPLWREARNPQKYLRLRALGGG
jgi:hypothetical protein